MTPNPDKKFKYKLKSVIERSPECRRKVINTKYLHLGKCIDRRKTTRRKNDKKRLAQLADSSSYRLIPFYKYSE